MGGDAGAQAVGEALGVFGCDAYYHVPKEQRAETFSSKAEPAVYLGHDSARGSAVVWSLRDNKLLHTRDLIYSPRSFTFAAAVAAGAQAVEKALRQAGSSAHNAAVADAETEDFKAPEAESPDTPEFLVERIVAQRLYRGELQYEVKWAGYSDAENTWEPAANVAGTKALDEFESMASCELDEISSVPDSTSPSSDDPRRGDSDRGHAISDASDDEKDSVSENSSASHPSGSAGGVAAPRRSPRLHSSSISRDTDSVAHPHVLMVMSALKGMQCTATSAADMPVQSITAAMLERAMTVVSGLASLEDRTPRTYREAMASPDAKAWSASMDREMSSCDELRVWDLVPRSSVPARHPVLQPKWVYKIKVDQHGNIEVYKSRLTPKGFQQKEGVDYFETFARTGMYKTMRIGLVLAAKWDHELDQLDVPTAFLNAEVDEDVYMELPEGYRAGKEHLVCKLRKSLYGLKQAPRNWYLLFSGFLQSKLGFKASVSDPCLLYKRSRTGRLILLFLFVDDCQVSYHAEDRQEWNELKAMLVERFRTKDLGPSTWILGMRIVRDRTQRTISLDQELYVTRALERYGLAECKAVATPEVICRGRSAPRATPEEDMAAAASEDPDSGGQTPPEGRSR